MAAGGGSQEGDEIGRLTGLLGHAFSDIWSQNMQFRVREVAFSEFLGYLLR